MLARIAHELYWVGRSLSRAEHTARLLDGVFHADLQGRADRRRPDAAVVGGAAGDHGRRPRAGPPAATTSSRCSRSTPTTRPRCCSASPARARARARVRDVFSRRDVGGDQHLPPRPAAPGHVRGAAQPARTRSTRYVRERCALFWGVTDRTMLRDEARAFLEAGAAIEAGDMVLRMLRVALPTDEARAGRGRPARRPGGGAAAGDGRLPGLPARDPGAAEGEPGRLASCSTSAPTPTRSRTRSTPCTTR